MALCLAESLIEKQGFDPVDQMERYVRWYHEGHLSSTGRCFGIGNTIRGALKRFEETREPFCGSTDPFSAGNGSIMRLAPVPMFFADNPLVAIEQAAESSRTNHGAQTAVDACRYMAGLIVGGLNGVEKSQLLAARYCPEPGYWETHPLCSEIDEIAAGSFKEKNLPEIKGSGYVVKSLEAALWAICQGNDFKEGALLVVNMGDDADTTGAVYGQIAGAFYGLEGIPEEWREKIVFSELILQFADQFFELVQNKV
jgi:ADP-ribosyl-[dinitrogen reductase] hydrolase